MTSEHTNLFQRATKNFGKVLTGKAVGAIISLIYLALAARGLGTNGFGIIILIHSYMLMCTRVVSFKSYDIIVKYGAEFLATNERREFQDLIKFTFLLDLFAAILGIFLGAFIVYLWGHNFGIPSEAISLAVIYCILIISNVTDTTTGILRICDRFDIVAFLAIVEPIIRLLGVTIAFYSDSPWQAYLMAWFAARISYFCISLIVAGYELSRKNLLQSFSWKMPRPTLRNPKIWSFSWSSNFYGSTNSIGIQFTTLAVGSLIGASGAALFKVAQELAEASAKAAVVFSSALYPELARLATSSQGNSQIRSVVRKTAKSSVFIGFIFTGLLVIAGELILQTFFGQQFSDAYGTMIILSIATSVLLITYPYEAALYSIGKPHIALVIKLSVTLTQLIVLIIMLQSVGIVGAGYAAVLSSLLSAVALIYMTNRRIN
ncbi:MAG: hypothetical protein CMO23_06580 [Thiotrichales bacterium]|nr:hypothetical protein [Thiotrichales bacterium]